MTKKTIRKNGSKIKKNPKTLSKRIYIKKVLKKKKRVQIKNKSSEVKNISKRGV